MSEKFTNFNKPADEKLTFKRTHAKSKNFTQIPNELINDDLTPEALTIIIYLNSKGDHWVPYVSDLQKKIKCGEKKTKRVLKELRHKGYMQAIKPKSADGRFLGTYFEFADYPAFKPPKKEHKPSNHAGSNREGNFCPVGESTERALSAESAKNGESVKCPLIYKKLDLYKILDSNEDSSSVGNSGENELVGKPSTTTKLTKGEAKEIMALGLTEAQLRKAIDKHGHERAKEVLKFMKENRKYYNGGGFQWLIREGLEVLKSKSEAAGETNDTKPRGKPSFDEFKATASLEFNDGEYAAAVEAIIREPSAHLFKFMLENNSIERTDYVKIRANKALNSWVEDRRLHNKWLAA